MLNFEVILKNVLLIQQLCFKDPIFITITLQLNLHQNVARVSVVHNVGVAYHPAEAILLGIGFQNVKGLVFKSDVHLVQPQDNRFFKRPLNILIQVVVDSYQLHQLLKTSNLLALYFVFQVLASFEGVLESGEQEGDGFGE